jgi:hypothetical protein
MYWFFKTNTNVSGEGKPEWEDVTLTSPLYLSFGICLVILFCRNSSFNASSRKT